MKKKTKRSPCPIGFALDIFGDRWTLLIIRDMAMFKRRTFKEFAEAGEGIATNILTDRLAFLEGEEIVVKERDPENRTRNIYTLTKKGYDLLPTMIEMIIWSSHYDKEFPLSKKETEVFQKNKEKYIASLLD